MATLKEKIAAEQHARAMLEDHGLPQPDSVEYSYTCVRLFWEEEKVVLVVDIVAPQRIDALGADDLLADHAGFTQHLEVVGAGRLDDREVEAVARALSPARRELGHDAEAHRIAEGVKHGRQVQLACLGMGQGRDLVHASGAIHGKCLHHSSHCTTTVELC